MAGEIIASVIESCPMVTLLTSPLRLTLPDAPAPTSKSLEQIYYLKVEEICQKIKMLLDCV